MATAFVFPGQGSQVVGMGHALALRYRAARAVFDEVDDALGERLSRLVFDGPEQDLTLTRNAQPALMAVSLAALRALEAEGGVNLARDASFVAGHSLGEYSALVAAGVFSLADAARLLRLRGEAMQAAVPIGQGAMAALIGVDPGLAREVALAAAAGEVCDVANDNGGGQVVLSGSRSAIERALVIAKERGIKRAVLLPVSAPFHCALMGPAAAVMARALAATPLATPTVPVVTNVTARPVTEVAALREGLVAQVCGTVRWRESVEWLVATGVRRFVEIGAGRVLSALIRRLAPEAETVSIGAADEVAALAGILVRAAV